MPTCGASVKVDDAWRTCGISGADLKSRHAGKPHRDASGYEWPPCSQMCAQGHVHGRYRIRMGVATGTASLASRTPKAGPSARRPKVARCKICLEPAELDDEGKPILDRDGTCADKEACNSRIAPLF